MSGAKVQRYAVIPVDPAAVAKELYRPFMDRRGAKRTARKLGGKWKAVLKRLKAARSGARVAVAVRP